MHKPLVTVFILASLAACGGGGHSAPESDPASVGHAGDEAHHGPDERHAHGEHGHPELPEGMRAFHDAFAPIWHSDPGPERASAACDATSQLTELAGAAETDAPDRTSPTLVASARSLGEACGDPADVAAIDAALTATHDAFHHILDALEPGGH